MFHGQNNLSDSNKFAEKKTENTTLLVTNALQENNYTR